MSAITELSAAYDYDAQTHDFMAWWAHHRELVGAMEPAQWTYARSAHGDEFSNALLSNDDAKAVREVYAQGQLTLAAMGKLFDVPEAVVHQITSGVTYKTAGGPITRRGMGKRPPNRKRAS